MGSTQTTARDDPLIAKRQNSKIKTLDGELNLRKTKTAEAVISSDRSKNLLGATNIEIEADLDLFSGKTKVERRKSAKKIACQ